MKYIEFFLAGGLLLSLVLLVQRVIRKDVKALQDAMLNDNDQGDELEHAPSQEEEQEIFEEAQEAQEAQEEQKEEAPITASEKQEEEEEEEPVPPERGEPAPPEEEGGEEEKEERGEGNDKKIAFSEAGMHQVGAFSTNNQIRVYLTVHGLWEFFQALYLGLFYSGSLKRGVNKGTNCQTPMFLFKHRNTDDIVIMKEKQVLRMIYNVLAKKGLLEHLGVNSKNYKRVDSSLQSNCYTFILNGLLVDHIEGSWVIAPRVSSKSFAPNDVEALLQSPGCLGSRYVVNPNTISAQALDKLWEVNENEKFDELQQQLESIDENPDLDRLEELIDNPEKQISVTGDSVISKRLLYTVVDALIYYQDGQIFNSQLESILSSSLSLSLLLSHFWDKLEMDGDIYCYKTTEYPELTGFSAFFNDLPELLSHKMQGVKLCHRDLASVY